MEISFIIPYYEVSPWLLRRCLESVCAFMQQVPDCSWEAWVVDDGSSDAGIARREVERTGAAQIHCLRVPHGGLGAARNAGLDHACGMYVFSWMPMIICLSARQDLCWHAAGNAVLMCFLLVCRR